VSSPLPVPPNSASSPVTPLPQPLSSAKRVLVALLVFLGIALSVAKGLLWSRGVWNAEVSGYAISALFISLVISYLIAGRKKNRKPVLFGLTFVGIAFVLCLMELSSVRKDPKVEVADLVREASGTKPIDGGGAFESQQDKLLREVMTELLDDAKAYREKAHAVETDLQTLYTPESFSSPEAMSRTRDSVQKITALDHAFVLQIQQWPSHVQEQTAQSPLSESDKQAFLKGFDETFSNSEILTLRRQADQIELQWCKDTLALYDFARSHEGRIHVKEARILIDDGDVRASFNDLLQQSREQHRKMADTNAQLAKLQQDSLQKFGLTRKDVGIVEGTVPTPQVQR
jgi:hypothetical protein